MGARTRSLIRPLVVIALLIAVCVGGTASWLVSRGLTDRLPAEPADVMVVLATTVNRNGQPSVFLRARLERAFELYSAGFAKNVLVSGALGVEGFDEAAVMADYLSARGVPREAIVVDSEGWDTRRTAQNTADVMTDRGWRSALIVTHYYHVERSRLAFQQAGIREVYSARERANANLTQGGPVLREVIGYYAYLVGF